jgi:glucose-6-phosphate dehydrogenase assembly protein OpcA
MLMVEFIEQGATILSEVYCKTLTKLHKAIQNNMYGLLIPGILVVLLHDSAHPHGAACTSLTQACGNIFPNMTSASIPKATTLRNSLSVYVYFVHNNF